MPKPPSPEPWLLLIHQLPPKPEYPRVKVWRRLQALGAVGVRNSVYVLPATEQTREDFQWLQKEIEGLGGEASICEARFVDGLSDAQIRALFNAARDADYAQLADEARAQLADLAPGSGRPDLRHRLRRLRTRHDQILALDHFAAPGRAVVDALLRELEAAAADPTPARGAGDPRAAYQGRIWATRPGIRVDRMASAWLIRRRIDPGARFAFVNERDPRSEGELRFDMADAEFTHEGDRCTFETLLERFELHDAPLAAIAAIIHDLDLKDGKFRPDEAAGLAAVLLGIERLETDDLERLRCACLVFDALYQAFDSPAPPARKQRRSR